MRQSEELNAVLGSAWPCSTPRTWSPTSGRCPPTCALCAPWLDPADVRRLQREHPRRWTTSDLPLLDAVRLRVGDPEAARRERRRTAVLAAERAEMADVVDHLIASDDSEMLVMSMLRLDDAQSVIVDDSAVEVPDPDLLAGPFAHVVVDEAQELTDAEWQMLLQRCPSRSFTVVGRPRAGAARLHRVVAGAAGTGRAGAGLPGLAHDQLPHAGAGDGRGRAGDPRRAARRQRADARSAAATGRWCTARWPTCTSIVDDWLAAHADGIACVIGDPAFARAGRGSAR